MTATAAAAAAMISSAAEDFSSESPSVDALSPSMSSRDADEDRPQDSTDEWQEQVVYHVADEESVMDGRGPYRRLTPAQLALVMPSRAPVAGGTDASEALSPTAAQAPLRKQRRQRHLLPSGLSAISARAVRISFLLQSWIRLWLTMVGFAVIAGLFMVLFLLRLLGLSVRSLPASAIASPVLAALSLLVLHAIVVLDGNGGTGGGAAIRAGGTRSALALGRRPVVVLALLCATIMVLKFDAHEVLLLGGVPSTVGVWAYKTPWPLALTPLWVLVVLVEGVYLRALWENRTGVSLSTFLWGVGGGSACGAFGVSCCLCGGDGCCPEGSPRGRQPTRHSFRLGPEEGRAGGAGGGAGGGGRVFCSSCIRRRAVLTQKQDDAAVYLAAGILFIAAAVAACATRDEDDQTPRRSWVVPITVLAALVGEALVGTGLWKLVCEYAHRMRGGLPPVRKPLPVFFSEREGGWTVGPSDPAVVSIFLLGEVTLRPEGVCGRGGGTAGGDSDLLRSSGCCC